MWLQFDLWCVKSQAIKKLRGNQQHSPLPPRSKNLNPTSQQATYSYYPLICNSIEVLVTRIKIDSNNQHPLRINQGIKVTSKQQKSKDHQCKGGAATIFPFEPLQIKRIQWKHDFHQSRIYCPGRQCFNINEYPLQSYISVIITFYSIHRCSISSMGNVRSLISCAAILVKLDGLFSTEGNTRRARWKKWARNAPEKQWSFNVQSKVPLWSPSCRRETRSPKLEKLRGSRL